MPVSRWTPFVTVAAVVRQQGRYLLVEENTADGLRLNNPAGHLEPGESPLEAVVREALEESAREFRPEALVGIYLTRFARRADGSEPSYLRIAYCGSVGEPLPGRALDQGIVRTVWLTPEEIRTEAARLRSPLVQRCVEDHLAGRRLPLDTIHADPSVFAPRVDPGLR